MSVYPDIRAGQRATDELLTQMLPEIIVKPSNTDRAATIVPAIDPHLQLAVQAGGVYLVEYTLWPAALLVADFKTSWAVPAGATGSKGVIGPSSTASSGSADQITMRAGVDPFATEITYSGVRDSGGSAFVVLESGIVTVGGTAGTIGLNWSQGTSNATASRLAVGSTMTVYRLA